MRASFSVIIPTLQRAKELPELVDRCAASDEVREVLVINNAPAPLTWESPKVRVLQQAENIYVNPAWNLGVQEATGEYVAILNDDLEIPVDIFDRLATVLAKRWAGMVGIDIVSLAKRPKLRLATHAHVTLGFGTFMAMRRADYVPIPDDLKIWGGDDWLFWSQRMPPFVLLGSGVVTELGTTSASPEFRAMREQEHDRANAHIGALWAQGRWWHRLVKSVETLRRARGRLRR